MTHKKISLVKSWVRLGGLALSLFLSRWQVAVLFLVIAEVIGIYEEKYEDTIPVKS